MRPAPRTDFDLLVVGGGMVGASFAAIAACDPELARLRIGLVDSGPPMAPPLDSTTDLRVSAISRASQRVLTAIGAWQLIPEAHRSAYSDMIVWDAAVKPFGAGSIHFSASESGEPDLGHIIENRRLVWSIYASEPFRERVTVLRSSVTALGLDDEVANATLSDGRRVSAALLIGADGASSASRALAGIETRGWDYAQRAFVTHVRTEHAHRSTAWQRFQPHGPIAFLPLADGRSSIVWTTTPEHAERLVDDPVERVALDIGSALDHVLGAVTIDGPRASFPLALTHADQYCRARFALIGDAAHAVHPLAGQGVNLGFMDCAALAQTLSTALADGGRVESLGELRVLRRYERWRKSENALALGLIDGLNRLFSNSSGALSWVRRTGLALVNDSGFAKRVLMGRAMGIAGEVPRLVKERARR